MNVKFCLKVNIQQLCLVLKLIKNRPGKCCSGGFSMSNNSGLHKLFGFGRFNAEIVVSTIYHNI